MSSQSASDVTAPEASAEAAADGATGASASRIRPVSTVEAVTNVLREDVLNGVIAAGVALRESELASQLGVSRHTLRAGLQTLVHDGLLRHEPNRGVFVPRLTLEDIRDLYTVRAALETEAVRIVKLTQAPLTGVELALDRLAEASATTWNAALEADLGVHHEVVAAAESPRLLRTFDGLLGEIKLALAHVRGDFETPALLEDHRELVAALKDASPEDACDRFREHLDVALTRTREAADV